MRYLFLFVLLLIPLLVFGEYGIGEYGTTAGGGAAGTDSFKVLFDFPAGAESDAITLHNFHPNTSGTVVAEVTGQSGVVTLLELTSSRDNHSGADSILALQLIEIIIDGEIATLKTDDSTTQIRVDDFFFGAEACSVFQGLYSSKTMSRRSIAFDSAYATWEYRVPIHFHDSIRVMLYGSDLCSQTPVSWFTTEVVYCPETYLPPGKWRCYHVEKNMGTHDKFKFFDFTGTVFLIGVHLAIDGTYNLPLYRDTSPGYPSTNKILESGTYIFRDGGSLFSTTLASDYSAGTLAITVADNVGSFLSPIPEGYEQAILIQHASRPDTQVNSCFNWPQSVTFAGTVIISSHDTLREDFVAGDSVHIFSWLSSDMDKLRNWAGLEEFFGGGFYVCDNQGRVGWPKWGWVPNPTDPYFGSRDRERTGIYNSTDGEPHSIYHWKEAVFRDRTMLYLVTSYNGPEYYSRPRYTMHMRLFGNAEWTDEPIPQYTDTYDTLRVYADRHCGDLWNANGSTWQSCIDDLTCNGVTDGSANYLRTRTDYAAPNYWLYRVAYVMNLDSLEIDVTPSLVQAGTLWVAKNEVATGYAKDSLYLYSVDFDTDGDNPDQVATNWYNDIGDQISVVECSASEDTVAFPIAADDLEGLFQTKVGFGNYVAFMIRPERDVKAIAPVGGDNTQINYEDNASYLKAEFRIYHLVEN